MIGLCYPLHHADRAPRQGAEHHLDRRLHRRALRQVAGGRRDGRADRHHRHDPLHRAAAQSGVGLARHHHRRTCGPTSAANMPVLGDIALFVALSMAAFAVLFGTRHIDATEHQDGLMLAIATESLVKLIAFLAVGVFVTFWMFDGPVALFTQAHGSRPTPPRCSPATTAVRHARRDDAAVAVRDPAAAAAVPRHGGREQRRARDQARRLAVPALSRADQPVRACRSRSPAC